MCRTLMQLESRREQEAFLHELSAHLPNQQATVSTDLYLQVDESRKVSVPIVPKLALQF